jgi:hypothetical protein
MQEHTSIRLHGDPQSSAFAAHVHAAFFKALALDSELPEWALRTPGMSGRKYRMLINALVGMTPDARYLEIGSWAGSTAAAAMYGQALKATCIDNWSEFGGPKDAFVQVTNQARASGRVDFAFIENDFRKVDYGAIGRYNLYLFDGPHLYQDQFDGVTLVQDALDAEHVLIVDDWNFRQVRDGTKHAFEAIGARLPFWVEIRTTQDDSHPTVALRENSEWHNGYFVGVVQKQR